MIYGPCGKLNMRSPCMYSKTEKCTKNYTKTLRDKSCTFSRQGLSLSLYSKNPINLTYFVCDSIQSLSEIIRFLRAKYRAVRRVVSLLYGLSSNIYDSLSPLHKQYSYHFSSTLVETSDRGLQVVIAER